MRRGIQNFVILENEPIQNSVACGTYSLQLVKRPTFY